MQNLVILPTKRNQVGFGVITKGAACSDVVNIEILHASTFLTTPTIALQDFSPRNSGVAQPPSEYEIFFVKFS